MNAEPFKEIAHLKIRLAVLGLALTATAASADEGMWTFDNFPSAAVKKAYGFEPDKAWLDEVRLASARLARGCSASFVSPDGLVMTNHHCARSCIDELSTAKKNLMANGFYAATPVQELKCPAVEVNQLLEISDVTARVQNAGKGLSGEKFKAAQDAERARIEKSCAGDSANVRCDVVSLYNGGRYHLYKYGRYQDVRLVFAPEERIAFFGGDPDNFEFPRYDLDVTFLRVYENGKPAKTPHYFKWSKNGAKADELTFITGNPWATSRLKTIAQLEYERDYALPELLFFFSEARGMLAEFGNRGKEQQRISQGTLFGVENAVKARKGRREALVDKEFFAQKVAQEKDLRSKVKANPELEKQYGGAWDAIAKAQEIRKNLRTDYTYLESFAGFRSSLFSIARNVLRASEELPKPNETRLEEFTDGQLPSLTQRVFSTAPIYPEFEERMLSFYLVKLREQLGSSHPVIKAVLGNDSPEQVARRAVRGSKLSNVALRKSLWNGGKAAVDASKDPMLVLARALDGPARAVRKQYEDQVEAVVNKNSELIAQARFAVYGTSIYPDATGSPRLSYGAVKGYLQDGKPVAPMTTIAGTFEHATGQDPFALPPSWLKAQNKLDGSVPFNFVTTNDIIGGNSGSPVINKDAEIVGIVFDGNRYSLGGEYGFDEKTNRAVSVHSAAIIEALDKVYGAKRLLEELR